MKQTCFSYFWCGFKIKTSVYAWTCDEQLKTCDEQPRTCEEHIRTFKNIQTYSMKLSCFNLRFSSWQHKQTVREGDYTFMQDPYGGGGDSWWRF